MTTGGIAGIVFSTYGARAGSRRGSIATTTTVASRSPVEVATAATRPSRTTRSSTTVSVRTVTFRVPIRSASAVPTAAMPPGTVHAPNCCSTYAVTPSQAGTLRRS